MTEFSNNPFRCSAEIDASALLTQINDWTAVQTFKKGINLTGIAAPPSAVNGQIYHYNKRFYLDSANRRVISRSGDVTLTPVTVANTDVEMTLWEGTVLPNTLAVGKVYKGWGLGKFSTANASAVLTIRTKLNGVELSSITSSLGKVTDVAGFARAFITIRSIGVAGTVTCFSSFQLDQKSFIANNSSVAIDTTSGSNMEITAQWNTAHAENTVTIDQGFLEALN